MIEAFWIIGVLVAIVLLFWGIDVYWHRNPLEENEILALSRKRQRNQALKKYDFSSLPKVADPAEKKAMKSRGEFVRCDMNYRDAPARIAGLLKYKKHEWIVIAFIKDFHITRLWWNKGPDGMKVWSFLQDSYLKDAIRSVQPHCIAILHNHPNPNPSLYRMDIPSELDLRSADFYDGEFSKIEISFLEFICERGVPHIYYASFNDKVVPVEPIIDQIREVNGTGIFKNYSLRKELKRKTKAEQIAGGNGLNAAP